MDNNTTFNRIKQYDNVNKNKVLNKKTKNFIEKAINVHKNAFNYSKINYINRSTEIEIICNTCNKSFWQRPFVHLKMKYDTCPKCRGRGTYTEKEYIDIVSKGIHKHKGYDYSEINYKGQRKNIIVICPIHGKFEQRADAHMNGQGCPMCKINKIIKPKNTRALKFISDCINKYDNKYNYSYVQEMYTTQHKEVKIICNTCGLPFYMTPSNHLCGRECPICCKYKSK